MPSFDTSIKKNTILGIFISLSRYIYPIATYPYITRVLQPEGLGRISFVASFVMFFSLLSQLGMPIYGLRSCAVAKDNKEKLQAIVGELLLIHLLSGCATLLLYGFVVFLVLPVKQEPVLFFIYGLGILLGISDCEWAYRASGRYSFLALVNSVFRCLAIVAVYLLVRNSTDLYWYAFITLLAGSGSLVAGFLSLKAQLGIAPLKNIYDIIVSHNVIRVVSGHLRPLLLFFLMSCAVTVYSNTDTVMLGFMKTNHMVGIYNASAKVKALLIVFSGALWTAALPRSAGLWKEGNWEGFRNLAEKSLRMIPIVSLPLAVFFIFYSEPSIRIIAGEAYVSAVRPMCILLLAVVPIGISNVIGGQLLIPIGQEKLLFRAEMAGMASNIVANAVLIPRYDVTGAAIATLLSETLVAVMAAVYIARFVRIRIIDVCVYIKSMAAFGTGLLLSYMFSVSGPVIICLTVAAVVFFVTFLAVLYLSGDELVRETIKNGVKR